MIALLLTVISAASVVGVASVVTLANATGLTLPEALAAADNRTAVVNAELELRDARDALARSQTDPLALRLERTQAEQRLALAEARLQQGRYEALAEVAEAYTQVLDAEAQRDLAHAAVDLAEQALRIARIRFDNGSATDLEVRDAQTELQEADNALAAATQGVQLARSNLAGLVEGDPGELEPIDDTLLPDLPPLEQVLATTPTLQPALLEAQQGRQLAALGVELLDPSYASRVQIEGARLQLEQAETLTREAQRGLSLAVRGLYNQARAAFESWQTQQEARDNALARLAIERQRFESGLVADIVFRQSELATRQTEVAAVSAKHSYLLALLELQTTSLTPLTPSLGDRP